MTAPSPARPPELKPLPGRYCRLEPLAAVHAADLFHAATPERFRYLFDHPPGSEAEIAAWIAGHTGNPDQLYWAVIDTARGTAEGRQSLMRIVPEHGVVEIGGIYWGPRLARTRAATEALYLYARYVFDDLGYRRFEWKCNARNAPSRAAAARFGFTFEGIFRQHMIIKGENRDTAWFAMLDGEWPRLRAEYQRWLAPANFDAEGVQRTPLRFS